MPAEEALLRDEILKLKRQRRAIILAHNYQRDEVQEIADFTGDSLELSRTASTIDCDVIVFAGVNFMAESASILCPDKTVLLTEIDAACPMADMIHVDTPRWERKSFPGFKTRSAKECNGIGYGTSPCLETARQSRAANVSV